MASPDEFIDWLRNLPHPAVQLHDHGKARYHEINLLHFAKDLHEHDSLLTWWKGKNMPPHLSRKIALAVLSLDPPEDIGAAMLLLMM